MFSKYREFESGANRKFLVVVIDMIVDQSVIDAQTEGISHVGLISLQLAHHKQ